MASKRIGKLPRLGDIVEIPTRKGLAYAQYTHEHVKPPHWGSLIRVLPGIFGERPADLAAIASVKELFFVFTPLRRLLREKTFCLAGRAPIPEWAVQFPVFRGATIVNGKALNGWWLWDGEREWRVGDELTPEIQPLSSHRMGSAEDIMARIELGWRAEDDGVRGEDELLAAVQDIVRLTEGRQPAKKVPWFKQEIDAPRAIVRRDPAKAAEYPGRTDYIVGSTVIPGLLETYHRDNGIDAQQFSGCGETFCYLKIDGKEGLNGSAFADRSQIEDSLDPALRSAKLGCVIGGGTGLRYSYVDFAVVDIDRACQAIRTVLKAANVPKRSWIQFFDEAHQGRWLGIWDETPKPP
jgi:hypothetical protein